MHSAFSFMVLGLLLAAAHAPPASAQTPPTAQEITAYAGLHAAAASGSTAEVEDAVKEGADLNARDPFGRTPLMVAVYRRDLAVAQALIKLGANVNALEHQSYDALTIAAVQNDAEMLDLLITSGGNTRAITSPYAGTALIAAAHLGNVEAVTALIAGRAPLDHVNRLGMTALIEAIVLGEGGVRHQAVVSALIAAGADVNLANNQGTRPYALAVDKGFTAIAALLQKAGATP
jgi:ankyrin repeat protein